MSDKLPGKADSGHNPSMSYCNPSAKPSLSRAIGAEGALHSRYLQPSIFVTVVVVPVVIVDRPAAS